MTVIVSADWLLPIAGEPIRDGAVHASGDRILRVGPRERLVTDNPDERTEHFEGSVLMPGLVNAHTHLALTVLARLIPPTDMLPFLQRVTAAVLAMSAEDLAASAALGANECLRSGVTCVGDIAYGPQPREACRRAGVAGVFFWEVLGVEADRLDDELRGREFPTSLEECASGRTRCGLSPHTAYTVGPGTLRRTAGLARSLGLPLAIHVSESEAEERLMLEGTGVLAPTAKRLADGFRSPGEGAVSYLDDLGVLDGAIAVHCVHLEPGDPERLAGRAKGVVLCPRSNEFLRNGAPPVSELERAGVPLALGTDSPASNTDLDLFAELRALRELAPHMTPARLLETVTRDGAAILGMTGVSGGLEAGVLGPGSFADLVAMDVGRTEQPEEAVVRLGGANRVRAVVSAGEWRIRDGSLVQDTTAVDVRAAKAREVAADAIALVDR
jgi:cytosine/adenosine deaminase-related metal-dependent hydrolase